MTQSYTCMKRGGRRCRRGFLNFIDHFSRHIVNVLLISVFLSHLEQKHGRPTAVQAFGIGILKLLWAHILSSHTAACTCTCSSNLCSNPVASYKTLDHPSHLSSYSGCVLVLNICCLFLSLYRWLPLCPALPLPVDPHQPAAVPVAAALCWSGSQDTATWTPGEGTEPWLPFLLHLCAQHAGEVSLCHSSLLLLKMI